LVRKDLILKFFGKVKNLNFFGNPLVGPFLLFPVPKEVQIKFGFPFFKVKVGLIWALTRLIEELGWW